MAFLFTLPSWHPTQPLVVITDPQLVLKWETEAKEVWEETAMSHALSATRAMYQFRYANTNHAHIALNLVRYGGVSYTNVVSEIASKITGWMKDHPFDDSPVLSDYELELAAERHAYGW